MAKTREQRQWEADDDARSLIRAQSIKLDPARHTRAKKAASKIVSEKTREANAAKKVASGASTRRTKKRVTRKKR